MRMKGFQPNDVAWNVTVSRLIDASLFRGKILIESTVSAAILTLEKASPWPASGGEYCWV